MAHAIARERFHKRIKHDITEIYGDPVDGIYVAPDDEKINILHALIVGQKDTPYENGFFYFLFTYPDSYPLVPPRVKFMTTGNGKVRFNPNLYACGKVCLSILGTWSGPSWTSVMTTKSVLISIQSLIMNEHPYFNEPGLESSKSTSSGLARANDYNNNIKFQTIRVAVIEMVNLCRSETFAMPSVLKEMVIHLFKQKFDSYLEMISVMKSTNINPRIPFPIEIALNRQDPEAAKSSWDDLKHRLTQLKETINSSNQENIAMTLYQSLSEAYTGKKMAIEAQNDEYANELFSQPDTGDEDDEDDDCVIVEPYSSEDDDEIQVIEKEDSKSEAAQSSNSQSKDTTEPGTSSQK